MTRFVDAIADDLPVIHSLLTRRLGATLCVAAALVAGLQWVFYAVVLAGSEGYVTRFGPVIGGDFVVFHEAAKAAWSDVGALYGYETLNARLSTAFPAYADDFRLGWQYPPAMHLVLAPLAALPYPAAYAAWVLLGLCAFLLAARMHWPAGGALLFLASTPAVFQAAITGQTGLFAAALLLLAAWRPARRPIVAGLAAGVLSLKPQLGLMIPLAFAAAGAWRAFGVAAGVAIALSAAAFVLYGAGAFAAFFEAAALQGAHLEGGAFPLHKLASVFGAFVAAGAPVSIAMAAQAAAFLGLAAFVVHVWRGGASDETKTATLMIAGLIAAPYVFYYELPIAALALFILAKRAGAAGFLPGEGLAIGALWLAPMFMPGDPAPTIPIVAGATLLAFALVARRAVVEGRSVHTT